MRKDAGYEMDPTVRGCWVLVSISLSVFYNTKLGHIFTARLFIAAEVDKTLLEVVHVRGKWKTTQL